jgi:hypothetical protein
MGYLAAAETVTGIMAIDLNKFVRTSPLRLA